MIDQLEPFDFGVASALIFRYCTLMPDMPSFTKRPRYRRTSKAPWAEVPLWVRIMSRLAESSVPHGWNLGFVTWIFVFWSGVNLSRTVYAYEHKAHRDTRDSSTAADLEAASLHIAKAIWSKYKDVSGACRRVVRDIAKLLWVPCVSPAANRLHQHHQHTCRRLPGTMEARRILRSYTQAHRIRYGTPTFVTLAPDESHMR